MNLDVLLNQTTKGKVVVNGKLLQIIYQKIVQPEL